MRWPWSDREPAEGEHHQTVVGMGGVIELNRTARHPDGVRHVVVSMDDRPGYPSMTVGVYTGDHYLGVTFDQAEAQTLARYIRRHFDGCP